jgi:hypothetical protein
MKCVMMSSADAAKDTRKATPKNPPESSLAVGILQA